MSMKACTGVAGYRSTVLNTQQVKAKAKSKQYLHKIARRLPMPLAEDTDKVAIVGTLHVLKISVEEQTNLTSDSFTRYHGRVVASADWTKDTDAGKGTAYDIAGQDAARQIMKQIKKAPRTFQVMHATRVARGLARTDEGRYALACARNYLPLDIANAMWRSE